MNSFEVLTVAGLYNSGPDHWQTHWEKEYGFKRIIQTDYDTPVCADWISAIDNAVMKGNPASTILIGHSLACNTIVNWANKYQRKIKAALLVAPSDTESAIYPGGTTGFMPMPLNTLPFPSITITSDDDKYVTIERAQFFTKHWGSELIILHQLGHMGSADKLALWPEGFKIFERVLTL